MTTTFLMQVFGTLCTAGITWILARERSKVEITKLRQEAAKTNYDAAHAYLRNVEDATTLWRNIAKDLESQVVVLTKEVHALREENKQLKQAIDKLQQSSVNK